MAYYGVARPAAGLALIWGYTFGRAVADDPRLLHDELLLRAWAQRVIGAGRRRRKDTPPIVRPGALRPMPER